MGYNYSYNPLTNGWVPSPVASQGSPDLRSARHLVIFSLRSPRSGEEGGEAVEAWDQVEGDGPGYLPAFVRPDRLAPGKIYHQNFHHPPKVSHGVFSDPASGLGFGNFSGLNC